MIAHVGPLPIEETVGAFGPFLIAAGGAGLAAVRTHVRRWRQLHHEEVRGVEAGARQSHRGHVQSHEGSLQ
jgi:hypothetical protein